MMEISDIDDDIVVIQTSNDGKVFLTWNVALILLQAEICI